MLLFTEDYKLIFSSTQSSLTIKSKMSCPGAGGGGGALKLVKAKYRKYVGLGRHISPWAGCDYLHLA